MKKASLSPVRALTCSLSLLIASFVSLSSVEAATIMTWGGDYVSATTSLSGTTTPVGSKTLSYNYSWTATKSPASGYSGPAIYGGVQTTAGVNFTPSFSRYQIEQNSSGKDRLRITGSPGASSPTTDRASMTGLVFFKKADFVNGGAAPGSTVTFDNSSSMSVNVVNLSDASRQIRMAVHASVDGVYNWYISQASATSSSGLFSIANVGLANWGLWSGVLDANLLPALPSTYAMAGSDFDDINASGFYFSSSINAPDIRIDGFTMNANVAIPEPSTVSALLLVGCGGLAWSWKKRAQKRVG